MEGVDCLSIPRAAAPVANWAEAPQPAVAERRAAMTMTRYWEGYFHARALNAFGTTIKGVSLGAGGLLASAGFVSCAQSGFGPIFGVPIFIAGALVAGLGYVISVLVQAAGQFLKAHFDCAVYQSTFLNDDQRAEVMSLR